jgi:acyl-CoA synthetase (AMP-forming)/AMP-acid ligase II
VSVISQCSRLDELVTAWARSRASAPVASLAGTTYSYGWLDLEVRRLAGALVAAGISRGDRVAVLQTPHPQFLVTLLAISSVGAIWVGLNPKYRVAELLQIAQDCQPRVLITRTQTHDRSYKAEITELRRSIGSLEHVLVFAGDPLVEGAQTLSDFMGSQQVTAAALTRARARVEPNDPCILVYTSGSTGTPKGALLGHAAILAFSRAQNEVWPVDPVLTLNYFPINHVGSVVDVSLPCLAAGGAITFMEAFDPAEVIRPTEQQKQTLSGSVPSAYQMMLATPGFRQADWSSVQLLVWEGAAMPVEAIEQLLEINCPLATNYNMTESSAITVLEPTRDLTLLAETVGSAYPGVSLRLVDAAGQDVVGDAPGEVWVKSPMNFLGYWNQPEATAAAFSPDGYFRTGDVAVRRLDGRYRLVGRIKELFKSGGYNVYPREVEAAIEEHPAVLAVAVVPRPDPRWQEVGVAFVVPKPGMSVDSLAEWLETRLANYKRPKKFVVQDSLPLLPIGKVDRNALRRLASQL